MGRQDLDSGARRTRAADVHRARDGQHPPSWSRTAPVDACGSASTSTEPEMRPKVKKSAFAPLHCSPPRRRVRAAQWSISSSSVTGALEKFIISQWGFDIVLRVRNGLFLTRNQAYYTRTPSGGTLGACATRQGGVGGGRASSPDRLAARSRGVKRVALRHSRAGGMAVGRGRL